MQIQRIRTGTPWEEQVGFSRVVRAGNLVWTAGTVAADNEGVIHGSDCYAQCNYIFEKLARTMSQAGSSLDDAVKVTCYITELEHADGFTRAHKQFLGHVAPACTCVVVDALFGGALAEIEIVAVVRE
jgi:enamine deaminase RidA (YjgF/YER057c/UK114 family)